MAEERKPEDITKADIIKALKTYVPVPKETEEEAEKEKVKKEVAISKNKALLIGAALVGGYLLLSKK